MKRFRIIYKSKTSGMNYTRIVQHESILSALKEFQNSFPEVDVFEIMEV